MARVGATVSVDTKGFRKASTNVLGYPKKLNKYIKQDLITQGFPIVERNIKNGMPVGKRPHTGRGAKGHMRSGKSVRRMALKNSEGQQGFKVTFYKPYFYAMFTNEGTGTSRKKRPLKFMQKGAEQSMPQINRIVNKGVVESMKYFNP